MDEKTRELLLDALRDLKSAKSEIEQAGKQLCWSGKVDRYDRTIANIDAHLKANPV